MVKKAEHSPFLLFTAAALLLTGGWLMASFPVFIFFGLAPLFALTDRATATSAVWEKMEWVLFALALMFFAASSFEGTSIVPVLIVAIFFTLPFIGHVWVRRTLGERAGKITVILFWLTLEYVFLKVRPGDSIFLADAVRFQPDWLRWSIYTGYLGSSLWILMTNLLVYQALLSKAAFRWYWVLLALCFLMGPPVCSYFLDPISIPRNDMVDLYAGKLIMADVPYIVRGEFVVRTAAWLSTLILLFTFVKSQTTR